jgi:Tir chaperone protein (CesT) family
MSQAFHLFIQDFARSKGLPSVDDSMGLEFECEGHSVILVQHPRKATQLMAEVSVTILDANPSAQLLELLLKINETARFEHDWTIVLDPYQQVSLSASADFTAMSEAALEAMMLDGIERAQSLRIFLEQPLELQNVSDITETSTAVSSVMMIRG